MDENNLLKQFIKEEDASNLYQYELWGKSVYAIIRPYVRRVFLQYHGVSILSLNKPKNKKALFVNTGRSFFHFIKLFLSRRKFTNCIFSFPRIERVGNQYVDKFSDPVISLTNLKNNTIVFEHSNGGEHLKPRANSKLIVYKDFFEILIFLFSKLTFWILPLFHKNTFKSLYTALERVFPYPKSQKNKDYERIITFSITVILYKYIYKRLDIKQVFGVSRLNFLPQICAAKERGISVYEFQHGVTFGETVQYSGERVENLTPDLFLSFGEIENNEMYGIDSSRIVNIGWAFTLFVDSLQMENKYNCHDVLVISDPDITEKICNIMKHLATMYPNYNFHWRPHPMETISNENLELIEQYENILLQDNKINSNIVLSWFNYVIGENSTVLYEAVSLGKKVGRLMFGGLQPKFLNPADNNSFFIIKSHEDFSKFIESSTNSTALNSIYSDFNGDKLEIFI